jgi:hypothetical protein
MKWHGRPAREITRKMRVPQQQNTRKVERDLRVFSLIVYGDVLMAVSY